MILDNEDKIEYITSKEDYENLHKDDEQIKFEGLSLSNIGECYIVIDKCGGNTPHFEIHAKDSDFKTCIKIYEPEYYFRDHSEFSKLTNEQINDLVNYMNTIFYKATNYDDIRMMWFGNNDLKKYDHYDERFNITIDYNLLKE